MAVPTQLSDLSATAASNSPAGTDTVGTTMDDFLRAHASIIARISAGTDALATPALGTPTAAGRISANAGLTVAGGTLVSRGITDSATATALTLSGSGANSITIANSATNPTIGTSAGNLYLNPAGGTVEVNGAAATAFVVRATTTGTPGIFLGNVSTGARGLMQADNSGELYLSAYASGSVNFYTNGGTLLQARVTNTAGADRYITLTGANAANPKISTSAGSLDIGAAVVFTGQTVGTTVGAAGAASALPAAPLGYITTSINGTACKIPYYNT